MGGGRPRSAAARPGPGQLVLSHVTVYTSTVYNVMLYYSVLYDIMLYYIISYCSIVYHSIV